MLCHGYMPIVIEAVPSDQFANWVVEKKNKFVEKNNNTLALNNKDN